MKPRVLIIFLVYLVPFSGIAQRARNERKDGVFSEKELQAEAVFVEGMKFFIAEDYTNAAKNFRVILEKSGDNAGVYFMLSRIEVQQGNAEKAVSYAEKAQNIEKENIYYQKQYGDLLVKTRRLKDAVEVYKKIARQNPRDVENYLALADAYMLMDKSNDAVKVFDELEKTIGVNEEITRQKQLIFLNQNKVDAALKEGDKLMKSEPQESDYLIQQAQIMMSNNRLNDAAELLNQGLKQNPGLGEADVYLSEIYRVKGEVTKSNEHLFRALRNKTLGPDLKLKVLGNYILSSGDKPDYDQLLLLTEEIINQAPEEAKGYIFKADLLLRKGEPEKGRDAYLQALNFDGSIFEVWVAVLELDGKLNQMKELVRHSEKALELFPNQAFLWHQNGIGNYMLKNYEDAVPALEEGARLSTGNPELRHLILALIGDAQNELKEYSKSDAAYEEVLKEVPDNEYVLNNYSYFLALRKQKLDRARELSTRLITKYPGNASYLDTHGWVLYQQSDYQSARKFIEQALSANPDASSAVYDHYGDVLFKLGEKGLAKEQWRKALSKSPANQLIEKKVSTGELIE